MHPVRVDDDVTAPPHALRAELREVLDRRCDPVSVPLAQGAMAVFDAPSRDVCRVLRGTTNTPLQALVLLHDPTYIEAARKLAELAIKGHAADKATQRIASAMRRTLSRAASERELALLGGLYRQRLSHYQSNPKAAEKLLGVGASPADPKLDRAQLAAMADVCLTILNLSETITRK